MTPFVTRIPVRFADVDYARIVYYPRMLHLLHVAFEEMFDKHVGIPYARLLEDLHIGFPSVHLECDFRKPVRFGEVIEVSISIPHVGRSSVEFEDTVRVEGPDDIRAQARIRRVAVDLRSFRPMPIPDDLRASLERLAPG